MRTEKKKVRQKFQKMQATSTREVVGGKNRERDRVQLFKLRFLMSKLSGTGISAFPIT